MVENISLNIKLLPARIMSTFLRLFLTLAKKIFALHSFFKCEKSMHHIFFAYPVTIKQIKGIPGSVSDLLAF